jgi:hypothetical protein
MNIASADFVVAPRPDGRWTAILNCYDSEEDDADMVSAAASGKSRQCAIRKTRALLAAMGELGQQMLAHLEVQLAAQEGSLQ